MARRTTALIYVYTSSEEIINVIGDIGFDQHVQGMASVEEYITELCERATAEVNTYLLGRFAAEDLSNSIAIREIATFIALYRLSIRMGQPELYLFEYQNSLDRLEKFKDGTLFLDIPVTYGVSPIVQNSLIDNRLIGRPQYIVKQTSSKVIDGQYFAALPYYSWWM